MQGEASTKGVHLAGMLRAVNEALQVSDPLIPVFEYLLGGSGIATGGKLQTFGWLLSR